MNFELYASKHPILLLIYASNTRPKMVTEDSKDTITNGISPGRKFISNGLGRHTKVDVQPINGYESDTTELVKTSEDNNDDKEEQETKEEEKDKEKKLPPVPVFQMFRYSTASERFLMVIGVLAAVLAGGCMPAMFILFGRIANAFVYREITSKLDAANVTELWQTILKENPQYANHSMEKVLQQMEEVYGGNGDFIGEVVTFGVGTIIVGVYRLRGRFLHSILRQEIGWFDTHKTNDFASRVTEDLSKMQEGMGEKIGLYIFFMVNFLSSVINAFVHGWELTLIILTVFPVLGLTTGLIAKIQANLSTVEMEEYARAGSVAEEVISAIRTVVAFGGEQKETERYDANLVHARKAGEKRGLVGGAGLAVMWFIIYAAYSLAFYYGTGLILESRPPEGDGSFDPGRLLIVFFSVLMGAMTVGQAAPYMEAFSVARGAAATIFDIVERESTIDPSSTLGHTPATIRGTIVFQDVYFNYPSRPDVEVLKGVSLLVEPGQTVALVGSSGCGKSTCVQLVQRFYDPLSGDVLLDGQPIRELNLGWVRDQVGVVGQEPVLFATSIAENIRYGKEDASMMQVQQAAKEANAHDFIMRLPKKYETHVGERGAQMSGGQKQRIAIARALVRQPRILLLDEATSALDNQSEAVVQQALDKVRLGRTTIIVAHRLTTIKTADKIVAFDQGKVVEVGTHDELMEKEGLYYNLVTAQLDPKELSNEKGTEEEAPTQPTETEREEKEEENNVLSKIYQEITEDLITNSPVPVPRSPTVRHFLSNHRQLSSKSLDNKGEGEEESIDVPITKILQMNSSEWPFILLGVTLSIARADEARREANFYSLLFLLLGVTFGIAQAVPYFAYAATMLYGGYQVDRGQLSYQSVFKVAEAMILGTSMVGQTVAFAPNYTKAKVAAGKIFSLLERVPALTTSPDVGRQLTDGVKGIQLSDVHFTYPSRPDVAILSGLDVSVGKGQTLALVGSSGCGKSTIISLLERFYDAKAGKMIINGEDLKSLNVGWVRSQLGLVSQEPVLFDRTIAENIAYGDNSRFVNHDQIVSAAQQANIHSFVESLPDKQRIAIARALVRNPSVLLLDEATSALDTESEKVVQEALEKAQEGRTSIVIAHRLSTVQGADTIAVVQGGKVVESGTHATLLQLQGHYHSLYQTTN
ncbi:ATP-dependent translocase ABCB1-like 1 [Homarus americanus]|uniref:ABC-type xenobiotic transporter n=1 Tax=Homarus americanus TaxID=6706 RepID=A0A8J5JYT2_HOMAM|nr:ATP-dependent translocase ABCB1-like 1 [Homarus americanus]